MHNNKIKHRNNYFEGWYFKNSSKNFSISFIPAYHIDKNGNLTASLQIITENNSYNINYKKEDIILKNPLQINLKNNIFAANGIFIDTKEDGVDLKVLLTYKNITPLKSDIMGFFKFLPMQCRHGIISMYHKVSGYVSLNAEKFIFENDSGYIETDSGTSFPKEYLWMQCHFEGEKSKINSLMISVANIPFWFRNFNGCVCSVIFNDKEYRLATYKGAKIETFDKSKAVIKQGNYKLTVQLIEDKAQNLKAPKKGEMKRIISECLSCKVRCIFKENDKILFDIECDNASFEYSKESEIIL
jgi:hypothetical protein